MRWFHDKLGISYPEMCVGEASTTDSAAANLFSLLNPDHPLLAISAKIVEEHRQRAVGEYRDVLRFVHSEVVTRPLADDVEPVDESEFERADGRGSRPATARDESQGQ